MFWFLAKIWDPPLKKFPNRTDLDWSATAIFMSLKEPNCFRKSLHDIASASSFYAWNENENNLQFLFLFFILLICSREIFSPKTENEFLTRNTRFYLRLRWSEKISDGDLSDLEKTYQLNILVTKRNKFIYCFRKSLQPNYQFKPEINMN